jgi:hypothetical protein
MLEVLQFIFSSFWTFAGTLVLVWCALVVPVGLVVIGLRGRPAAGAQGIAVHQVGELLRAAVTGAAQAAGRIQPPPQVQRQPAPGGRKVT